MKQWILLMIGLIVCAYASAQLVVVNTDGPTVGAERYVRDIHYPKKDNALSMLKMNKSFFRERNIQIQGLMYPATSDLTAGKIISHPLKTNGLRKAVFVIGDDPFSVNWAKTNAHELRKIGAIGIITNVKNQDRVQAIENETGLTLLPTQLTGLSHYLQVSHYPFLWTQTDVEQ